MSTKVLEPGFQLTLKLSAFIVGFAGAAELYLISDV